MKGLVLAIGAVIVFGVSLLDSVDAFAATSVIAGKTSSATRAVVWKNRMSRSSTTSRFSLQVPTGRKAARLLLKSASSGKLAGAVVFAIKTKKGIFTVAAARKNKSCRDKTALAIMGLTIPDRMKKALNVGTIANVGSLYYTTGAIDTTYLATRATARVNTSCAPLGTGTNFGLLSSRVLQANAARMTVRAGDADDKDGDGLPDDTDIDADNNGTLDAYDKNGDTEPNQNQIWFFSNLKVELEQSVNVNALRNEGTISSGDLYSAMDQLVQTWQTLAMAVAGKEGDTVVLNCGALSYCRSGGTGRTDGYSYDQAKPFPGTPGDASGYDPDGDGLGLMTRGGSAHDFQLNTGAKTSEIGSGDVLTEIINKGSSGSYEVTAMLEFAFVTNPAIKSVQINGGDPITFHYPVSVGAPGTNSSCIRVPASGDVTVAFEAWRPQRKGISGAGESEFVDIGKSQIVMDMANAPALPGESQTGTRGPGNCVAGYSTTDPNLEIQEVTTTKGVEQRLWDTASDTTASTANTYTFSINLDQCFAHPGEGPGQAVTWGAGQQILIDLEMRNSRNDNAAQHICFVRDSA